MKAVILAEKPSVGRDIARVLKCTKRGNGFLEGDKYIITWALGHLVTLAAPEQYDNKYKTWNLEHLPIMPRDMKLVVIPKSAKQYNVVKHQLLRKDVNKIIIATDAGREGELVARWIITKTKVNKPLERLWISSVTDKAILEGFRNLKSGKNYNPLFKAALARAEADWLIGMNGTRALTVKYNAQLTCGRVQTPTLALIALREAEISAFVPRAFYGIVGQGKGVTLKWHDNKGESRSFSKEKIEAIIANIKGKEAVVTNVTRKKKQEGAPLIYDCTELQREANRRYQYSAKETLSIMQRLYENHKIITYPRTDSRYLTSDIVQTIPDRISACRSLYKDISLARKNFNGKNLKMVNDSKVTDHHGIIPTEKRGDLSKLDVHEERIYRLVVERFLAGLMPPYEYEEMKVQVKIGGEEFRCQGRSVLALGWKILVAKSAEKDEEEIVALSKGERLKLQLTLTTGETKPPLPHTEATLLTAMENPTSHITNSERIKTLKATGGLGTVATRADIIEKLLHNFLIEKRSQHLHTTSKGRQLLELAPEKMRTPDLTADWELTLDKIARGLLNKEEFMGGIVAYTKELVTEIKESKQNFRHDNLTGSSCPECGKLLLEVKGKQGLVRVCQDRECGYRKQMERNVNSRCPNCHKKMTLVGAGEGKRLVCKCGYREKLSGFTESKRRKVHGASKGEIAKYIGKQKETDKYNPFAEAFGKLQD